MLFKSKAAVDNLRMVNYDETFPSLIKERMRRKYWSGGGGGAAMSKNPYEYRICPYRDLTFGLGDV